MSLPSAFLFALIAAPTLQSGSAPCGQASLQERVAEYLADSDAEESDWGGRSELVITEDGAWTVTLQIEAPDGSSSERSFVAERCDVALDAAAFVLATAIDPDLEARGADDPDAEVSGVPLPMAQPDDPPSPDPAPASPPQPVADSVPPPVASRSAASSPERPPSQARTPVVVGLFGAAGVMGGALPAANAAFELGASLGRRSWRAELSAIVRLPSESRSESIPDVLGQLGIWALTARGCGHPGVGRVSFPLCAGLEVGQAFGRGRGFSGATRTRVPWGAAIFGPAVRVRITPRVGVLARAELGVPLNHAEFVIDGLETLHTVGSVFGRGTLGIEVQLGRPRHSPGPRSSTPRDRA